MAGTVDSTGSSLRPLTRRAALAAIPASLLALTAGTRTADARRKWCRTDPVVVIGGALANILVSAPLGSLTQALMSVTGPNQIVISVPEGVDAWLVLSDLGFGRGNTVTFAHSPDLLATAGGIEVRVEVFVPAKESFPVLVEFAPQLLGILSPASAEGTTNARIALTATL